MTVVDLRVVRQVRCAATAEGHRFTPAGTCERCDMTVHPRLRLAEES